MESKATNTEMLTTSAFVSLTRRDIQNVPETVLSAQFTNWFYNRLRDSCSKMSVAAVAALKDGTWNALVSEECCAYAVDLKDPCKKTRFMLHSAANWMGLRSYTEGGVLYVMRDDCSRSLDDMVFVSHDEAIVRGAKKVIHHVKRPSSPLPRISGVCDGCDKNGNAVVLYMSVYHHGVFCLDCLESGECETDPCFSSKWEDV